MASISDFAEVGLLNAIKGTSFSVAATYIKLHTADPGEAGTTAAAANSTRTVATWTTATSGAGGLVSIGTNTWATVANAETITHFSVWDNLTAGNCIWGGALSSSAVLAVGDTLNLTLITLTLD